MFNYNVFDKKFKEKKTIDKKKKDFIDHDSQRKRSYYLNLTLFIN
jgi:hypothetical protein